MPNMQKYVEICRKNMQIYAKNMDSICKYMQTKCAKHCKEYAKYAEVHILYVSAYICTPNFADGGQHAGSTVWRHVSHAFESQRLAISWPNHKHQFKTMQGDRLYNL